MAILALHDRISPQWQYSKFVFELFIKYLLFRLVYSATRKIYRTV